MGILPWWRQRRARGRAVAERLAAVDQEIGSRLDSEDRLARIRAEVLRLRHGAELVRDSSEGGSFAAGAVWAYCRTLELFDAD